MIIYENIKRVYDMIGSIIGIVVLLPVLLLISIGIKIDSKGPVFHKAKRLGNSTYVIIHLLYPFPELSGFAVNIESDVF